ncbi:MAG: hypothetical protein ACOC38_12645 [Promethearchaeia archaeon]
MKLWINWLQKNGKLPEVDKLFKKIRTVRAGIVHGGGLVKRQTKMNEYCPYLEKALDLGLSYLINVDNETRHHDRDTWPLVVSVKLEGNIEVIRKGADLSQLPTPVPGFSLNRSDIEIEHRPSRDPTIVLEQEPKGYETGLYRLTYSRSKLIPDYDAL